MKPVDIVMKRTGMPHEDAVYYVSLSLLRVQSYLHLADPPSGDNYLFAIANIAVLMWQSDNSVRNSAASLGFASRSFSEGGVSRSETGMTGQAINTSYEDAIMDELHALDGAYGGRLNIW